MLPASRVPPPDTLLFDLGGVLIDWNPRYLYCKLFGGDEAAMERFLTDVCATSWNHEMDAGKPFAQAVAERQREFPQHARLIALWDQGWEWMLGGPIAETVEVLRELRERGHRLGALTNWSAEKFPLALARYEFLDWFEDIVVSGQVGLAKPDPQIFRLTVERLQLDPARTVYIDDNLSNVEAGSVQGFRSLHFRGAQQLRTDLLALGLL